jgi:predicted permease
MGVGWAAARWRALEPGATPAQAVALLNTLVMRVCLPALQLHLLGVQTDMSRSENWRWVGDSV